MTKPLSVTREERLTAAARELLARRGARRSLIEFCQFTLPRFQTNWHLEFLAKELEKVMWGKTKRLMIFMPPRHGKSEMVSVRFPAFYLLGKPQNQVIACSYSGSLAYNFSNACRQVMQGQAFQRLWPVQFTTDAATHWQIKGKENNRNSYIAAGVGGGISGEGADLLIIDDPVKNAEEADSFVIREKQWDWYRTTARTRLQPNAAIVVVQTRWHEDDLSGRLLRAMRDDPKADQWKVILLPAINDSSLCVPSCIGPYDALWPEQYPPDQLSSLKATVGPRTWSALFQQRPSSSEGRFWKREWFKHFYKRQDRPTRFDEELWSWDMTFKETKDSDFVVGQHWGRIGPKKYLLHQVRARMDFTKTCAELIRVSSRTLDARKKLIEDKANGPAIISALKDTIEGIIAVPKTSSKEACWAAATTDFEAGDVIFPHPDEEPWVHDVIDELCSVPEGALFDDQADATAQAINYWRQQHKQAFMELRI
jgi:predicted phage terminase large subunit-like protein